MKISVGLVQIIDYYAVGNSNCCGNISVSMSVPISTAQFKINKLTIFETVETLPGEGRKQKLLGKILKNYAVSSIFIPDLF